MPSQSTTSIFTAEQYTKLNKTLRDLQNAKDLCEKAGKCGLPTSDHIAEIDAMTELLTNIKKEFMHGQQPAANVPATPQAEKAKRGGK